MTDAAMINGRQRGEAHQATAAVLDLLLDQIGITFDRWVVLNAVASKSLPAQVGLLVPALSAALDAADEAIRFMLDEAESARHIRVVSAPTGDLAAARVELTTEGEMLHERLQTAIDQLTAELSAGNALRDLEAARHVLVEIAQQARARLDSDPGVRFSK